MLTKKQNSQTITKSIRQRVLKGLLVGCSAAMLPLGAQEDSVVKLPEETVKGQETEGIRPSSLPNIVSAASLQHEEFRKYPGQRSLGDVITRLPGVAMDGPPNQNKDINLRGLDKNFTRFEFDGVQIPVADKKRAISINRFSSLLAGEVLVLRAPTAEYEADGIAGKILVESRKIPDTFTAEFKVGYGGVSEATGSTSLSDFNGDYKTAELFVGGPLNEQWSVNAVMAYTEFPFQNLKDVTKRKTIFKTKAKVDEKEFEEETKLEDETKAQESINLFANLEYKYETGKFNFKPFLANFKEPKVKTEPKTKKKFNAAMDGSKGDLTETTESTITEDEGKDKDTNGIILENEQQVLGYNARVESLFSYFETTEEKTKNKEENSVTTFENGDPDENKIKFEDEVEDKDDESIEFRSKLIAEHNFMDVPNEFRTGFQIRFKDRDATKQKTETEFKSVGNVDPLDNKGVRKDKPELDGNFELEEDVYAGFVQNEFQVTPKLSVMPGVRVEYTDFTGDDTDGNVQDKTFTDVLPNLNAFYQYNEEVSFTASVTRSLNRPNFNQLSPFKDENPKDGIVTEGNPDLDPARSWNFDAGVTYEKEKLYLTANIFHKEIEDVIELSDTGEVTSGLDVSRFENVGDGWLQGIELEQQYIAESFIPGLILYANQTVLDSELTDTAGLERSFDKQPDLIANLGFDYTVPQTQTTVSFVAKFRDEISEIERDDVGEVEFESETKVWFLDVAVRQPINENFTLVFEGVNLTNENKDKTERTIKSGEIEVENKLEQPGRFFSLAIEGSF